MTDPVHVDSASIQADIDQQVAGYFNAGNSGAAITLDYRKGRVQKVVLTASAPTITVTHVPPGARSLRLLLTQDATGTRLLPTFVPAANYGVAGAPTLSTAANKIDLLDFLSVDSGASLLAMPPTKGF